MNNIFRRLEIFAYVLTLVLLLGGAALAVLPTYVGTIVAKTAATGVVPLLVKAPAGSTVDLTDWYSNASIVANMTSTGVLVAPNVQGTVMQSEANGATFGYLAPCYAPGGTACANTIHEDYTVTSAFSSGTCPGSAGVCTGSTTVNLTGIAQFTNSHPSCSGSEVNNNGVVFMPIFNDGGALPVTSIIVGVISVSGGSSSTQVKVALRCEGT